jgi:beta-xylosidase
MQQLDSAGATLVGERSIVLRNNLSSWEAGVVEAPWIVKPSGSTYYYLFYSAAHCCDGSGSYAVGVARSLSILGPYVKYEGNPILHSNTKGKGFDGTGHCSVVQSPSDPDVWVIFYHAYVQPKASGARSLLMDTIRFDKTSGWPHITTDTDEPSIGPTKLPLIEF